MLPVRLTGDPRATTGLLVAVALGVCLGTVSGLVPGLHANTFALLLAALAPQIPAPRLFVGAAMLAAGVVHTFLDVVPALALGVPDPAMAVSGLPGHRLVLAGRGREALRLSAVGSGGAVVLAVPLAVPVTAAMTRLYPTIAANLPLVLGGIALVLVLSERRPRRILGAGCALTASGALGVVVLDAPVGGVFGSGDVLVPLFAGLFGAPVLLAAIGGAGVPPQDDATLAAAPRTLGGLALIGTLCGAVVGYLPGVSSAVAATLALGLTADRGPRAFVVTTSGVNTATAVFALFALVALGTPRTGVLVAVDRASVPLSLPHLLASVALAALAGALLVPTVGDRYLRTVGRLDPARLSVAVLALLCVLSMAFAGPLGLGIFGAATLVGHVPGHFGARRATLMGVLLVPLAL